MSETKFTKGEWVIMETNFGEFITSTDRLENSMVEICKIDTDYDGYIGAEQSANAHLIAAAPEMYETIDKLSTELLHMIRAENARLLQSVNSTDLDGPDYLDEESVYLARKLLAKARGEHE